MSSYHYNQVTLTLLFGIIYSLFLTLILIQWDLELIGWSSLDLVKYWNILWEFYKMFEEYHILIKWKKYKRLMWSTSLMLFSSIWGTNEKIYISFCTNTMNWQFSRNLNELSCKFKKYLFAKICFVKFKTK